jgi:uncharacterized protein (DUF427 family)
MWKYNGQTRPPFADNPGPGQESVWDYPRPPIMVADQRRIIVRSGELIIADSTRAQRILETAGPPTFYIPPQHVRQELLQPFSGTSVCEWKGSATYWSLKTPSQSEAVGWSYPAAQFPYHLISGYFAFYPGRLQCFIDGERVRPQPGYFYGGWITNEIVGPWKGERGTEAW